MSATVAGDVASSGRGSGRNATQLQPATTAMATPMAIAREVRERGRLIFMIGLTSSADIWVEAARVQSGRRSGRSQRTEAVILYRPVAFVYRPVSNGPARHILKRKTPRSR